MKVEILFIKKENCGICEMMNGAWKKIKEEKPDWLYVEKELSSDSGPLIFHNDVKYLLPDHSFPMFFIFIDDKFKEYYSGGMRYRDLINKIEGVIEECQ